MVIVSNFRFTLICMKKYFLLLLFAGMIGCISAQSLYFPPLNGNSWDTVSPVSLGWCPDKINVLYDYLEDKNSKAFMVLKDGKMAIEKYFGTFTRDSLWYWASAGKTLTAFTVGIARQEGLLSIHDTTSEYLGQGWTVCPPDKEEKITIRHQLTMTSGLNDGVPDHYCTLDTCLQYLADAGTRWAYHNGPYTLLDGVIQAATGQSLNVYFTQKVKIPTGITGLFIQAGYNNVYVSNARSMARFGLLMLNRGNWNDTQVMTDTVYYHDMINTSQALNPSYGYLWWLNGKSTYKVPGLQFDFPGPLFSHAPADMYAALGKDGQILNVVPSQNLVVLRLGNAPGVGEVPYTMNDTIWQKLNDVMCNVSAENYETEGPAVQVFPNPVKDHLQISGPVNTYRLLVSDIGGRTIFYQDDLSGPYVADASAWQPGVYFLRVQWDSRTWFCKVIKE